MTFYSILKIQSICNEWVLTGTFSFRNLEKWEVESAWKLWGIGPWSRILCYARFLIRRHCCHKYFGTTILHSGRPTKVYWAGLHGTQILLYRMGHAICPIAILVVQTGNIWLFCITPFGLFWGISIANKYSYCEGEGCLWSDSIAILVVQTGEHLAYLYHTIRRRGPVFFVGNYRTHRWRCDPYCELFLKLCSGFEEEKKSGLFNKEVMYKWKITNWLAPSRKRGVCDKTLYNIFVSPLNFWLRYLGTSCIIIKKSLKIK